MASSHSHVFHRGGLSAPVTLMQAGCHAPVAVDGANILVDNELLNVSAITLSILMHRNVALATAFEPSGTPTASCEAPILWRVCEVVTGMTDLRMLPPPPLRQRGEIHTQLAASRFYESPRAHFQRFTVSAFRPRGPRPAPVTPSPTVAYEWSSRVLSSFG